MRALEAGRGRGNQAAPDQHRWRARRRAARHRIPAARGEIHLHHRPRRRIDGGSRRGVPSASARCASSSRWSTTARLPARSRHMARTITVEETAVAHELVERARAAMDAIAHYDQPTVDRLCRAIAWAGGNEPTAIRLANMSVDESGMGKREPTRRAKVLGILRDALRQKSMGIIEEDAVTGAGEVCETCRRDRLADSRHEPVRHARRNRDLRGEVQRRGHLFAASFQPQDDHRDGQADAGGAGEAGRPGRRHPGRRDGPVFRSRTS